jgi:hypothetical protein
MRPAIARKRERRADSTPGAPPRLNARCTRASAFGVITPELEAATI